MLARLGEAAASAIVAPLQSCYGQGETPLFIAARNGHLEVVKCFIEQLGDTAVIKKAINTLQSGLHHGLTILQGAIMDSPPYIQPRNIEVVKYLLQNGASLRLSEHEVRKFKEEPQLKKTYRLCQDFVKFSKANDFNSLKDSLTNIKAGEIVLGFSINDDGDNMLHALVNAYIDPANIKNQDVIQHCIEVLIALDVNRELDTRNKYGKTAMHLALEHNITWLLEMLKTTNNEVYLFTQVIDGSAKVNIQELKKVAGSNAEENAIQVNIDLESTIGATQYEKGSIATLNTLGLYTLLEIEITMLCRSINAYESISLATKEDLQDLINIFDLDISSQSKNQSQDSQRLFTLSADKYLALKKLLVKLQVFNREILKQHQRGKQPFDKGVDQHGDLVLIRDQETLSTLKPYLSIAQPQLMTKQYDTLTTVENNKAQATAHNFRGIR